MREAYSLVLGRDEEHALRREIWAVWLAAWIFMVLVYFAFPIYLARTSWIMANAEGYAMVYFYVSGFTFFKAILNTMFWWFSPDMSKSGSRRCSALLQRICHEILWSLLSFVMYSGGITLLFVIQSVFDPSLQNQYVYI